MDPSDYADTPFGAVRRTGGPHGYLAYFPKPIPRQVTLSVGNVLRLGDAEAALGRLAGAGRLLPVPHLLVRPYLRREAVASTRIEGPQASLAQLFDAEASGQPYGADIEDVVNYIAAMETGLRRLETLPVSARLIREMHAVILAGVRGRHRQPGELRTSQNWIGPPGATIETASFVPPPPGELGALLSDLERFIHEEPSLPALVQAALVHYQLEVLPTRSRIWSSAGPCSRRASWRPSAASVARPPSRLSASSPTWGSWPRLLADRGASSGGGRPRCSPF